LKKSQLNGEASVTIEYDDKGKYFTNIVSKNGIPATIQTQMHLIQGYIHVKADERVIDELNKAEPFLAVTDAHLFDADGNEIMASNFVTINRSHIIWLVPDEEKVPGEPRGEK
jgi:hypothetical protein